MPEEMFGRDMLFYTFDDFMLRRLWIKMILKDKDYRFRTMYRMYVDSRPFVKEIHRGYIWEYLNEDVTDEELSGIYLEYREKLDKKAGGMSA